MIEWWDYWYGYEAPEKSHGSITTLPFEPERDLVAELRATVEEITGQPVEAPPKRRIGFVA